MSRSFTKMHGLGNDFVVIDATRETFVPDTDWLRRMADRRRGIGFDQLLVLDPPPSAEVDFGYRIYNADGSEVGQCGNGARCLARFALARGLSSQRRLRLATATTRLEVEVRDDDSVSVILPAPEFEPAAIPLATAVASGRYKVQLPGFGEIEFGAVGLGNPHAVIAVADVGRAPVGELGQKLQLCNELFPEGVNVGFAQFGARDRLRLRVYERGAGETEACGSGACAAFAVGRRWGLLDDCAEVELRGGTLRVCWAGDDQPLTMFGPAETVYQGCLP
ncbi:MAG: diaminopimelate epimerase [Gammaproteobacteria bacterium]|nr:diaminopimelate epimerase [Gammaproteobacteria bacterium]